MYRILVFVFFAILSQVLFAQSSPVSEFENQVAAARSCVKGFATASQILGKDQYKGTDNAMAVSLVKNLCSSDSLVVYFYRSQRNTQDAKSLDEVKIFIEDMIADWFRDDVEMLNAAENSR